MIELRITGETPQEFLQQLIVAHAAMTFRGVVAAMPAGIAPEVANDDPNRPTTTDRPPDQAETKPGKRGRPRKEDTSEPTPAAETAAPETGAVTAEVKPEAVEIETPKDKDAMRALLNTVIMKVGTGKAKELIAEYGENLSAVGLDKYPEMARKAHKLITAG